MTQEEKELLLKDLCARLPYGVKASNGYGILELTPRTDVIYIVDNGNIPFLRPLSSMTEEEKKMYTILRAHALPFTIVSWLDEHMFDHRTDMSGKHLIELGLALEVPKGIYNETV